MANTTWSTTDKLNVTLSGSNLIATAAAGGICSVRAIDKQLTGKFYWECTCNTLSSIITGVGVHAGGVSFASGGYSSAPNIGTCGVVQSGGNIYVDGSHSGQPSLGAFVAGNVICIAVDAGARLIWFRVGAAGNWNGSAANNPATGIGGVSITNLGIGIQIYPSACFGTTSDQVTANFGDSAFTGTVPAGFTSGFTAGAILPSNVVSTQTTLDQWANNPSPDMQATQLFIEQWAEVQTVTPQLILTQVLVDQWASVAVITPVSNQARAWIMA